MQEREKKPEFTLGLGGAELNDTDLGCRFAESSIGSMSYEFRSSELFSELIVTFKNDAKEIYWNRFNARSQFICFTALRPILL